jgi:hypothetical protein
MPREKFQKNQEGKKLNAQLQEKVRFITKVRVE